MHRRGFLTMLAGGLAVAASGPGLARQATDAGSVAPAPVELDKAALDQVDAEFSHMPPGPRWRAHRAWHRQQWRHRRRWNRRMLRRWRRGRWYYY